MPGNIWWWVRLDNCYLRRQIRAPLWMHLPSDLICIWHLLGDYWGQQMSWKLCFFFALRVSIFIFIIKTLIAESSESCCEESLTSRRCFRLWHVLCRCIFIILQQRHFGRSGKSLVEKCENLRIGSHAFRISTCSPYPRPSSCRRFAIFEKDSRQT